MTIEQYLSRLQDIANEHPGARMMAFDPGNDYNPGGEFDSMPEWSERDQVVYSDVWEGEEQ